MKLKLPRGVMVAGPVEDRFDEILTEDALQFVAELTRRFWRQRDALLSYCEQRRSAIRSGQEKIDFLSRTSGIRHDKTWRISNPPSVFWKPGVEITAPTDRKMMIGAFNSDAEMYMADFEDSCSPTWKNIVQGQINLYDAVRRTISFEHDTRGKIGLDKKTATLLVRPRGWHLSEPRVMVDGRVVPASLFDFGMFFYHNAHKLVETGSGPYFYLAKLEGHEGARLWAYIFKFAEEYVGLPHGTIKATVLIEHILAALETHEILYVLRDYSAGLNVGRWDYIASLERMLLDEVFPERGQITMDTLAAYVTLVAQTCYARGAPFIGGMEAQIPVRNNPEFSEGSLGKAMRGKERELAQGAVRAWVAHPGMVEPIGKIFREGYAQASDKARERYLGMSPPSAEDLLRVPEGTITELGLREDIVAFTRYVAVWLSGTGAVAIDYYESAGDLYAYLMEDAATAEIARAQIWKWLHHGAKLDDGRVITIELIGELCSDEMRKLKVRLGDKFDEDLYDDAKVQFFFEIGQPKFFY